MQLVDNSMTELFRNYEEEFISSITTINKQVENISILTNHKKELAFNDIKADLTECEKDIKLMEAEVAVLNPTAKFDSLRKIRQYKKDFDNCRKALFKAEQNYVFEKNKEMLVGAELDEGDSHRSKFIQQGQVMSDMTDKLKDGLAVMHQTRDIGNNIEEDLYDHTGRLIENKKKLGSIRENLGKSSKLIKTMMGRIRRNKFVLFSVLGLIFLVVLIILGVHFSKK